MLKKDKPIGLLGGTFDPVHHGHLRLAIELYEQLDLAEVRLILSAQPPHREQPMVNPELRLTMVESAIQGIKGLRVDDRELQRGGPSYMIDTLQSLREEYPTHSLCLILGMDAFMGLPHWHQWQRLITLAHFLVVRRPGVILSPEHVMYDFLLTHQIHNRTELTEHSAGNILLVDPPALAISATQIRALLAMGRNPRYLLPRTVLEIIYQNQLYG